MKFWDVVPFILFVLGVWSIWQSRRTDRRRRRTTRYAENQLLLQRMLFQVGFGLAACLLSIAWFAFIPY